MQVLFLEGLTWSQDVCILLVIIASGTLPLNAIAVCSVVQAKDELLQLINKLAYEDLPEGIATISFWDIM